MHTRVLFLDFDGVIITPRATTVFGGPKGVTADFRTLTRPDPVAIAAIAAVCAVGVGLVISSSWRKMPEQCRRILDDNGLAQFLHDDWRTREDRYLLGNGQLDRRGNQIADWLESHPEVRAYRILDDSDEMLSAQRPFFVHCHAYDGLSYQQIDALLKWANAREQEAA